MIAQIISLSYTSEYMVVFLYHSPYIHTYSGKRRDLHTEPATSTATSTSAATLVGTAGGDKVSLSFEEQDDPQIGGVPKTRIRHINGFVDSGNFTLSIE